MEDSEGLRSPLGSQVVKYTANAFHATKIAFANEIASFAGLMDRATSAPEPLRQAPPGSGPAVESAWDTAVSTDSPSHFRPDIEGLRAVAILAVLAYHARLPWITGGFVGVDVFFVISGFLITGLLLREFNASGRIDLPAFYARRARRLLPAALVVIAVTVVASAFILSAIRFPSVAGDGAAAALYVSNYRFALSATRWRARTSRTRNTRRLRGVRRGRPAPNGSARPTGCAQARIAARWSWAITWSTATLTT